MKTSINFKAVATLALIIVLSTNCSKNSSSDNGSLSSIVTSGQWHVSLFSEHGNNETSDFNNYNFTFLSDGTLMAEKGSSMVHGTWSENSSSKKLIINLGPKQDSNKPLGELTDDWEIVATSGTKISLTDDNSSRDELLEFTRH